MRCITTTTTATNGCRFCEGEDVRDFASKQDQSADSFPASAKAGTDAAAASRAAALKGMEEMSKVCREGGDLYLPSK